MKAKRLYKHGSLTRKRSHIFLLHILENMWANKTSKVASVPEDSVFIPFETKILRKLHQAYKNFQLFCLKNI